MIEYWHWHTNHFGTETYWIGILPHDQQPGRVYNELSRLGAEFRKAGCTEREAESSPQRETGQVRLSSQILPGCAMCPPPLPYSSR